VILKTSRATVKKKIRETGFCLGGAIILGEFPKNDKFSSAVPFYNVPDLSKAPIAKIKVPIIAHFGENV
jgi:dienelactone hydrolase